LLQDSRFAILKIMQQKHLAILDFGSQYMHLIVRAIRHLGVSAKIYPTDVNAHDLHEAWGIIISGGPQSVVEQKLSYDPGIFKLGIPVLGLCYGHQLMAHHLGGQVTPAHHREYGRAEIALQNQNKLFFGLKTKEQVWMSHWDSVTTVPAGFKIIGKTADCPVAAMADETRNFYGLQFHPEVHHTLGGVKILENFVFKICRAEKNWSMSEYLKALEAKIKKQVGEKKVFLLVSGGVDSSVAFALLQKILGKQRVYGLHIDNGFMRLNESLAVKKSLAKAGFDNLKIVNASDQFLQAVEGVVDPEEKRKIIGRTFLAVQKAEFKKAFLNEKEWLLGQGTIYPDTIESGGTKTSDTIKTHHNRVDEVLEMINKGLVVEPLVDLYKDEVRQIGQKLGLDDILLKRWPFPGPGLAIRCLCSHGTPAPDLKKVDKKLTEIIGHNFIPTILPLKSVGVQGDQRSYCQVVMLQGEFTGWTELDRLSTQITNKVTGLSRVVLDVTPGQVAATKMQLKRGYLTKTRLHILQQAEKIVQEVVIEFGIYDDIWQFPVILLPLSFGQGETVVLRPFESREVMTANFYPMPQEVLQKMVKRILQVEGIGAVMYDITNKPPATTEWE